MVVGQEFNIDNPNAVETGYRSVGLNDAPTREPVPATRLCGGTQSVSNWFDLVPNQLTW